MSSREVGGLELYPRQRDPIHGGRVGVTWVESQGMAQPREVARWSRMETPVVGESFTAPERLGPGDTGPPEPGAHPGRWPLAVEAAPDRQDRVEAEQGAVRVIAHAHRGDHEQAVAGGLDSDPTLVL